MTEKQIKKLAREIRLMKDGVSKEHRLLFARAIRDVVQETKDFPGWTAFLQDCGLDTQEEQESDLSR